jgi:hypothetical protein
MKYIVSWIIYQWVITGCPETNPDKSCSVMHMKKEKLMNLKQEFKDYKSAKEFYKSKVRESKTWMERNEIDSIRLDSIKIK